MISISETAQAHFAKLLADQSQQTNIRVFVVNPGTSQAECGVSYCPEDAVEESDIRLNFNGFDAVVDAESGTDLRQKLKKLREITTELMSAAEVEEG